MPRVVCFGSLNMDVAVYSATLPRAGETLMGTSLAKSPGGKGLNQAVAARRLGAQVTMAGCIGRDLDGDELHAFLQRENIDVGGLCRIDGIQTGAAVILVDAVSENAIVVVSGANMAWPPGAVSLVRVTAGDLVLSQFEVPDAVIIDAFARARSAGSRTILNAAPSRAMPDGLLALVDILVANEVELAAVAGTAFDPGDIAAVTRTAADLSACGLSVVTTIGSKGAIVAADGRTTRIAGRPVQAIDTAGAGDCFIGAMAAALCRGEALGQAARFANRAAGMCVTRKGTAIAMPYASEL